MPSTTRTTIPAQAATTRETLSSPAYDRRRGDEPPREWRRRFLAVGSVVAAFAATGTLVALVLTGVDDTVSPMPGTRVVAPGPVPNGSDQHLLNRAREHAQRQHARDRNRGHAGWRDVR
jgi:hypothetical protein